MAKEKEPVNKSRIVIEGIDEPAPRPKYHDRIKIDPWKRPMRRRVTKRA